MALPALLGAGARAIGGSIVKSVAKDKAKSFIQGKKASTNRREDSNEPTTEGGSLVIRPKTSLVSPSSLIPPESPGAIIKVEKKSDILKEIRDKVYQINDILKNKLIEESKLLGKEKKEQEKVKRGKQESELEKVKKKDKKKKSKLSLPGTGLFKAIFDFISNIFIGRLLFLGVDGVDGIPGIGILKMIGGVVETTIDVIIGIFDAFGTFLMWGQKAYDATKRFLKDNFGNGAEKAFTDLMKNLNTAFNLIATIGLLTAAFNPFEGLGKDKNKTKTKSRSGIDPKTNKPRRVRPTNIVDPDGTIRSKTSVETKLKDMGLADNQIREYNKALTGGANRSQALTQAKKVTPDIPKRGGLLGFFAQAGDNIAAATKGARDLAGKGLKAIGGGLDYLSGGNLGKLGNLLQDQYKNASEFTRKQYDNVVAVGQKLKGKYDNAVSSVKSSIGNLAEKAQKKILQPILDKIKPFIEPIIEKAKSIGESILKVLKKIPGFDNVLQVLKKKGINSLGDVGGIAKKVGGRALPFIGGLFNLLFAYDRFASGDTIGGLLETISAGFDFAGLAPVSMGIDAYMFARDFVPAIQETEESAINALGLGGFKSNVDKVVSKLPDLGTIFSNVMGKKDESGKAGTSLASTTTGIETDDSASNLAGEAGKFIEKNLESAAVAADGYGDYNRITEHPDFGGVRGTHATGSYHYINRAIDIGAFTNEQEPIVNVLNQFNKMKGVQPKELITGSQFPGTTMVDPGGHDDHVHVAYRLGGLVKGLTHAILGEQGPEYVIDTDSYEAIESAYPGLFDAINTAEGPDAVSVLMDFTSYERPQEPDMAMAGGESETPTYSGGDDTSSMISSTPTLSKTKDNSFEITYKF
tara:strand:+ start:2106 stop:4700 length:2595 start_codon:yes stop_codon:yes gene_type:complete